MLCRCEGLCIFYLGRITKYIMNKVYKSVALMTWTSFFLLIVPILVWGVWIYISESNPNATQQDKAKLFHSYFPKAINDKISIITLICCLIAIVLASITMTNKSANQKGINIIANSITIIIGSVILFLQLLSML